MDISHSELNKTNIFRSHVKIKTVRIKFLKQLRYYESIIVETKRKALVIVNFGRKIN